MEHTSSIELSHEALNQNICFMRDLVGPHTRYSMVIKSNAYGHGIEELVPMIEGCGVDHLSVFSLAEAKRAHAVAGDDCEIMIMGWIDDDHLEWAIGHDVSFFVFTPERLRATVEVARALGRSARVHLELETGMHRTGFVQDQLDWVVRTLEEADDALVLEGLCSHLAGAESAVNYTRVRRQIDTFSELCHELRERGLRPRYRHLACTAGALRFPESILDMVRVGIANYGFWPSEELRMNHLLENEVVHDPLVRVLSWRSTIMSVNEVPSDEYVSYGNTYLTNRPSRIATVPVGYGYGFSRNLSNAGHVLVHGRRVPVAGLVNMNMLVIDVTDLDDACVGDEVTLIGRQGDRSISVSSFGDMNNALNYELLTRLPDHIPRRVVD